MSELTINQNPYNYHLPVQTDAMFFGRAQLLTDLMVGLAQPSPLSAAVFGGRRCGKTSLLRKLERDLVAQPVRGDYRLAPWYYDPQAGYPIASSGDFFALVLDMLRQNLAPNQAAPPVFQAAAAAFQSALRLGPARAFEAGFAVLAPLQDRPIRLVLLMDEAEILFKASWGSDLRPNLRSLLSNSPIANNLALVMAGSTAFHTQVAEKDSPLENILTRYSLTGLTREETMDLACRPTRGHLSSDSAQEVWTQTGGHPCLVQFILHELWQDLPDVTPADVQDVAAHFGERTDHFERWYAALPPPAGSLYGWLADQPGAVSYTDIRRAWLDQDSSSVQRALDALSYHGLIQIIGRGRRTQYAVSGSMFRDWYRSSQVGPVAPTGPAVAALPSAPAVEAPACEGFDVEIETRAANLYEIQVLQSPVGSLRSTPTRSTESSLPAGDEWTAMLRRVRVGDVDAAMLSEVGRQLRQFLFPPPVWAAWTASRETARARERGLCLRLRLHQPELSSLPWELLYDENSDQFLTLSPRTPLARVLPGALQSLPGRPTLPWRLLVVSASPQDRPLLDVAREQNMILQVVNPLVAAGRLRVECLPHATPPALLDALRRGWHWLHWIGHSEYDSASGRGALILENADGSSARLDIDTLRHLLPEAMEQAGVQLEVVLLNACSTAQVGLLPGTRGLAQTLVQAGIPTAVGMSRPIADHSARALSEGFYGALVQGWPLAAAVTEGRRRMMLESGLHSGDWAAPLLLMRMPGV